MRQILNAGQIRELDAFTIQNEPISSIDLMERAAQACVDQLLFDFPNCHSWVIWCGTGNNGGDGLAIARLLHGIGGSVHILICGDVNRASADFKVNFDRLESYGIPISPCLERPKTSAPEVVHVDCLFGSGLNRPISGEATAMIDAINLQEQIVSIDLPSGLPANIRELLPLITELKTVHARYTYTFDSYKFSLLVDDLSDSYGKVRVLDIGLDQTFKKTIEVSEYYRTIEDCRNLIVPRRAYLHKGRTGHALLAVGKTGMMGAAVLATRSCLRCGVGLVTVHSPQTQSAILQISSPEAICRPSLISDGIDLHFSDIQRYSAIGVGCGIGIEPEVRLALRRFINDTYQGDQPLVLDADALNIIADAPELLQKLAGKPVVLTPHPREFDRLFGQHSDHTERIGHLGELCRELRIHILLKGANSWTSGPDGELHSFPFPNDGLAKGGSGDVLMGILNAFLAQGYNIRDSICLAVGLQAHSAQECAAERTAFCMLPGDLVDYFPRFFRV
ncbi:MAG: NAD(P)H-hydrate dehydratase [Flavobacteriales bacterium]|nr:NAD(P)H-hydrate dehydratase [Flavobacteriales bacterium]